VGHIENGSRYPFEVWINGAEQPRGLGALAKSLSMDMRSEDRGWLKAKLESLKKVDDAPFNMYTPDGAMKRLPGVVAALAQVVEHRVAQLGAFESMEDTPLLNALLSRKEPKTGPDGTMSWTVDVLNPATGDDFVLGLKEMTMPDGQRRPYSVWLSGNYPRAFDGLCKTLSFDMRVYDPAWIGKKLRQLVDYAEPLGDFMARVPGQKRQMNYPSTVAYIATLILHRFSMLGILDEDGMPIEDLGALAFDFEAEPNVVSINPDHKVASVGAMEVMPGKLCGECGSYSLIRKDGCDFCTSCGYTGACG
jgi:ribonucleoside-diphosphate reductase alpha chain